MQAFNPLNVSGNLITIFFDILDNILASDNILSKFLSVVSDEKIITEFRSVERILTDDGKDSNQYESVRIKNHSALETVN